MNISPEIYYSVLFGGVGLVLVIVIVMVLSLARLVANKQKNLMKKSKAYKEKLRWQRKERDGKKNKFNNIGVKKFPVLYQPLNASYFVDESVGIF